MKRAIRVFLFILIIGNLTLILHLFRTGGYKQDFDILLETYIATHKYIFQMGLLSVVVDWISKDWIRRDKPPKYEVKSFYCEHKEILCYIPKNTWSWYIYEINAIDNGKSPIDLNVLNKELADSAEGYYLSWEELKELLTSLVEIKSCLIVALNQKEDYQDVVKDDFVDFLCLIRIKDGSSCEIKLNKSLIEEKSDSDNL